MVRGPDSWRGGRRPAAARPVVAGRGAVRARRSSAPPRTLVPDRRQLWFATSLACCGAALSLLAALYLATNGVSSRPGTVAAEADWRVVREDRREVRRTPPAAREAPHLSAATAAPPRARLAPDMTGAVAPVAAGFVPTAMTGTETPVALLLRGSSEELPTAALRGAKRPEPRPTGPAPLRLAALGDAPQRALLRTDPVAEPRDETRTVVVAPGDTLSAILDQLDIPTDDARALLRALTARFDPQGLRPGDEVDLTLRGRSDGTSRALGLTLTSGGQVLEARRAKDGGFEVDIGAPPGDLIHHRAVGTISGSLYGTARAHGVPDTLIVRMMRTHAFDVDFQREIHPGDGFEVFYSRAESETGAVRGSGTLLFSSLTTGGIERGYYRFVDADGATDDYDAEGVSVKKPLMKTPINGARISSGFGMRKHPILGYSRMHTGTDFAAPTGTPILAAGDGTIDTAGRNGGYGNYIRVEHRPGLKTAYAHLSRFAKGMRKGKRVRQGQIIGYVGTTGRSTGPHLHYEVQVNGAKKNPLTVEIKDTGKRLAGAELARFQKERARIDALRDAATPTLVASVRP